MRRSTLPRDGRVFRRCVGRTRARSTRRRTFARASSTFCGWSRVRWLVTISRPSAASEPAARAASRRRASPSSPSMRARSTRSSTLLDTLLTFWPPGPLDRVARRLMADTGTTAPPRTIALSTPRAYSSTVDMAGPLEASLAVLNGVLGDYLARTDNGLATEMELFLSSSGAGPLALERGAVERALRGIAATSPGAEHATSAWSSGSPVRVVVLVHGLMWTETVWRLGDGSDYRTRLAADLGFVPLYVRYNTGLPLAENGALLDRLLTRLLPSAPWATRALFATGPTLAG